jgi:hypothetical protein
MGGAAFGVSTSDGSGLVVTGSADSTPHFGHPMKAVSPTTFTALTSMRRSQLGQTAFTSAED